MTTIATKPLFDAGVACLDFLNEHDEVIFALAPTIEDARAFARPLAVLQQGVANSFLAKGSAEQHRSAAILIEEAVEMVRGVKPSPTVNQIKFMADALQVVHAYRKAEAAAPRTVGVGILYEAYSPESVKACDASADIEAWRQEMAAGLWDRAPELADQRPADPKAAADAAFARPSPFNASFSEQVVKVQPYGHAPAPAIELPTMRAADLSTAHLTLDTRAMLEEAALQDGASAGLPIVYDKGGYGYLVHVDPVLTAETLATYPEDLQTVIRAAGEAGCDWIMFDGAGPVVEHLPVYDDGLDAKLELDPVP